MDKDYPDIDAPGATKGHIFDHKDPVGAADIVSEGVGGLSGGVVGLAVGALGGPVGMVIGAAAGVLGGWWTGRTLAASATRLTEIESDYFARRHSAMVPADSPYTFDAATPAYTLGKNAALNPEYAHRSFDSVEPDLERTWSAANTGYDWSTARPVVREAFDTIRNPSLYGLPVAPVPTVTTEITETTYTRMEE